MLYCTGITFWEGQALEQRNTGRTGGRRLATGHTGSYDRSGGRRRAQAYDWEKDSADCRVPNYDNYEPYGSRSFREEPEEYRQPERRPQREAAGRRSEPARPPRRKARRPWRGLCRVVTVLSALIIIGYLGVSLAIRPPEHTEAAPPPMGQPADPNALTRRDRTYTVLLAATDEDGVRTDTMMVATYDVPNQKVGVVSIPRDTLTCRPQGANPKLVYGAGGVEQRVKDLSAMLGIPIDFYVKVDIRGFIALVDYLDGIDFYVPCDMKYDDPFQGGPDGLHIHFKEGMQHLTGQEAMEVARFRKNNDKSGYSDVGRTQTQQQLLLALAEKLISWDSVTRINGFVELFHQYVETNMKLKDMMYFASKGLKIDPGAVETATLEGRGDGVYYGTRFCYELDRESTVEVVNRLLNPYTRDLTLDDMKLCQADRYMT